MNKNAPDFSNGERYISNDAPYASCGNCRYLSMHGKWGCYLREEEVMWNDKSPCMIWDDGKDEPDDNECVSIRLTDLAELREKAWKYDELSKSNPTNR